MKYKTDTLVSVFHFSKSITGEEVFVDTFFILCYNNIKRKQILLIIRTKERDYEKKTINN